MSSAVGDESELRKRKVQKEAAEKQAAELAAKETDDQQLSPEEQEYVDYFKSKYGENPRTDILGIDGCGLFVLIYILVAGIIFSIIWISVYARHRDIFHNLPYGFR
eukprot:gb/GFBE01044306.1/.p1 GENE.gb/GFBE01044306.1/~~gb/GFBE01044306.1/.p1  ORF type:complete len:106 (+),score=36.53 gb/GFBE01044306.1/:1-318(+)